MWGCCGLRRPRRLRHSFIRSLPLPHRHRYAAVVVPPDPPKGALSVLDSSLHARTRWRCWCGVLVVVALVSP